MVPVSVLFFTMPCRMPAVAPRSTPVMMTAVATAYRMYLFCSMAAQLSVARIISGEVTRG